MELQTTNGELRDTGYVWDTERHWETYCDLGRYRGDMDSLHLTIQLFMYLTTSFISQYICLYLTISGSISLYIHVSPHISLYLIIYVYISLYSERDRDLWGDMERYNEKWNDIGDVGDAEQTWGGIISFCTTLYLVLSHYFSTYLSLRLLIYTIHT